MEGGGGAISRDGTVVAFTSQAANLPGGDGSTYRVYARNMKTGKTKLASVDSQGDPATGDVFNAVISANGRYVAFHGDGDGLPGAGLNAQVWVHDLKTGKTMLASKAPGGAPGDDGSFYPALSDDGRYAVFESSASNLPGGDGSTDLVYARDLEKRKTILVSKTNGGDPAMGRLYGHAPSSDGSRITFYSFDADLPGGDGAANHVYVRNLEQRKTILVDRANNGSPSEGGSSDPSISGNGRFVAFDSVADDLPGSDGSYVRDLRKGTTRLISRNSAGEPADGASYYPHLGRGGRWVAFYSESTNLPGGDGSDARIYLRDLARGKTSLVSRKPNGAPPDSYCEYPSLSLDSEWASFYCGSGSGLGGNGSYTNVFRAGPLH
jgi:Tol biopolymer transport system component